MKRKDGDAREYKQTTRWHSYMVKEMSPLFENTLISQHAKNIQPQQLGHPTGRTQPSLVSCLQKASETNNLSHPSENPHDDV